MLTAHPESPLVDRRYRIEASLGSGAMGTVHLATDVGLDRPVALKIIAASLARDPRSVARFQTEARGLASVRHPHVVEIYAYGPHERTHYFAMEYVRGCNLEALITEHTARGTTLPLPRALTILRQIASGLNAVHAKGLIHRDVKPANIVIEETTGRPVLVDFGLVLKVRRVDARDTFGGGTPSYMAPEQAFEEKTARLTLAADVYALACTAWELMTGRAVFSCPDLGELLRLHQEAVPHPISSLRPELGAADGVFSRALSKAPEARYPDCIAFVAALEGALAEEFVPFARTVRHASVIPLSRKRAWWLGAGIAAAVGGLAFATIGTSPRAARRPNPTAVVVVPAVPAALASPPGELPAVEARDAPPEAHPLERANAATRGPAFGGFERNAGGERTGEPEPGAPTPAADDVVRTFEPVNFVPARGEDEDENANGRDEGQDPFGRQI